MEEVLRLTIAWLATLIVIAVAVVVLPPVFDTIEDAVRWLWRRIS